MLAVREIDPQVYRGLVRNGGLVCSRVRLKQSDLLISACRDLSREAMPLVVHYRGQIEDYIAVNPFFLRSMVPVETDEGAPEIVRVMIDAGAKAGVGPMAAVAGALAEFVGRGLMESSPEIIVENGGDIFFHASSRKEVLLLAESSPLKGLRIAVGPTSSPIGICTSSGILGHSISFGNAHAVMIVAASASLADAAATSVANIVKGVSDIERGLDRAREIGTDGAVILASDRVGAWGRIEIVG
ncbi:MAG: UPF0280 family protein [Syntrophobacteraceae bacterium]|nr:UPF0280 family protein [Syntrophobacteraceae bacterium]